MKINELKCDGCPALSLRDQEGIVLADCAFCPLHELGSKPEKQKAASQCLRNHNLNVLEINPAAPIITIFPANRGYIKAEFPEIESRKVAAFSFLKLSGLKAMIEQHAR